MRKTRQKLPDINKKTTLSGVVFMVDDTRLELEQAGRDASGLRCCSAALRLKSPSAMRSQVRAVLFT